MIFFPYSWLSYDKISLSLYDSDATVGVGRSTPCAIAEATDVKTADPAYSVRFGTPSFVCFDCSQPSVFEYAFLHSASQLANRRFKLSRQHDNQQQPQGKGAATAGPGHR